MINRNQHFDSLITQFNHQMSLRNLLGKMCALCPIIYKFWGSTSFDKFNKKSNPDLFLKGCGSSRLCISSSMFPAVRPQSFLQRLVDITLSTTRGSYYQSFVTITKHFTREFYQSRPANYHSQVPVHSRDSKKGRDFKGI